MNIEVSSDFKKHAKRAVLAIILFCVVFFLMISIGLGIAFAMIYFALYLSVNAKDYRVLLIGITIAGSAVILLIFLFKFMFQKSVSVTEGMLQIYPAQHPKLFKMIEEIANEVKTDMPKKVFISDQVNASVFYNSSFWSMLMPVRKNLIIGYGLVNLTTEQELKGILAHEFGHFSQDSMKVGSYVYNCNRIVYNLVYENSSFENIVRKVSSFHAFFLIVVGFSLLIMKLYQFILKGLYKVINLTHLSLSREMEFHADAVATNIVGSEIMGSTLARLDLSDYADQSTLNFINSKYKQGFKVANFYRIQSQVLKFLGEKKKHRFNDRFPVVTINEIDSNNKSRLNIKDQWASHPTMKERIQAIDKLKIVKESGSNIPASNLFSDTKKIEETLTKKFYKEHELIDLKFIEIDEEMDLYSEFYQSLNFNPEYNGFFNNKNPLIVKPEFQPISDEITFDSLFTNEQVAMVKLYQAVDYDYRDIKFLATEKHSIKTFDFDGIKYKKKQASSLLDSLNKEKETLKIKVDVHDALIYNFFYQKAKQLNVFDDWNSRYDFYIEMDKFYDCGFEQTNKIEDALSFMQESLTLEVIQSNLRVLHSKEVEFKAHLIKLEELDLYRNEISDEQKKIVHDYIENSSSYLVGEKWNDSALNLLFGCLRVSQAIHSDLFFSVKKNLLDYQANQLK